MQHKAKWIVGLDNGETHYEEKGLFTYIEGELSPWQRLLKYLAENRRNITSLGIYTEDGKRFNLPSRGKNPKFKAFVDADKPVSYRAFRRLGVDVQGENAGKEDLYTVAEATYEDGRTLQIWVDETTGNVWTLTNAAP